MTQYWLWIGYRLPGTPDLAADARRLEANALSTRNVELQACRDAPNPFQCRRDAEVDFRERILGIPGAQFVLDYSEHQNPSGPVKDLLVLTPEWASYPGLDQNYANLNPNLFYQLGLLADTWTREIRRAADGEPIHLPADFATAIFSALPREASGPKVFGLPLVDKSTPRPGNLILGMFAAMTLLVPLDVIILLDINWYPTSVFFALDWFPATYSYLASSQAWTWSYIFQGEAAPYVASWLSIISLGLTVGSVGLYFLRRRRAAGSLLLLSALVLVVYYVYSIAEYPGTMFIPGAFLSQIAIGGASLTKASGRAGVGSGIGKSALGTFLTVFGILIVYFAIMTGVLLLIGLAVLVLAGGFVASASGAHELSRL